jgi:hypothetical protein
MPFSFLGVKECVLGLHFVAKPEIDKVLYHQYHLHKLKGAS